MFRIETWGTAGSVPVSYRISPLAAIMLRGLLNAALLILRHGVDWGFLVLWGCLATGVKGALGLGLLGVVA